jgi:hypothetical protein
MNVVAVTPDRDNYILPLEKHLKYPLVFLRSLVWEDLLKLNPVAVLFLGDFHFDYQKLIDKCRYNGIPTILLMDGTIEWKHFFENPKWSFGGNEAPYFPLQCDKIFVPGPSTYRFLEYFGNSGKCEITGFPRLDLYKDRAFLKSKDNAHKTIGIMSANTAGYTAEQISESKKLFEDLYIWSKSNSSIHLKWRLRKGFDKILDIPIENDSSASLIDFLQKVDAVICQPSTAAYEAMMLNIPTALADYSIAPNYMHAAWEINSSEQIDPVINSLLAHEPMKVMLQQHLLDDTLSFKGNSAEFSSQLIHEIISFKNQNHNLDLPANLYLNLINKHDSISIQSDALFPNQNSYRFSDLNILRESYTKLEVKLKQLHHQLSRRTLGFWFDKLISKVLK